LFSLIFIRPSFSNRLLFDLLCVHATSYASDFGATDAHVLRRICGFMAPQGSKPPSEAFTNLTIMLQVRAILPLG
jgi:hypothetical protein